MTQKEKEIQNFMVNLNISRAEAEQLWLDDNSDEMTPEQAELDKKAKLSGANKKYIKTEKVIKRTTSRERKVDGAKAEILKAIIPTLEVINCTEISTETETCIHFVQNGVKYSLKLTKHREKSAK